MIRARIALMMQAASRSETSSDFYQTTRRNNPEDSHLHTILWFQIIVGTGFSYAVRTLKTVSMLGSAAASRVLLHLPASAENSNSLLACCFSFTQPYQGP
jgi:hypothetical protein